MTRYQSNLCFLYNDDGDLGDNRGSRGDLNRCEGERQGVGSGDVCRVLFQRGVRAKRVRVEGLGQRNEGRHEADHGGGRGDSDPIGSSLSLGGGVRY